MYMRRHLLWQNIFLLMSISLFSQTFVRTYHFNGMTGGLGLSKCADGGFVGTGQHENGPAGGCDIYVYRVSNCGNILWYKTFGTSNSDGGRKVIQASDGGYLVAGLYDDGGGNGYDYCLMKLNAAGNVLWNNTFNMGNHSYNIWVDETPFGIATCGWYYTGGLWQGLVVFYNTSGSLLWAKRLIGGGHIQPNSIHFSGSNFWVCGGTTAFGAGSGDLFVLKLDAAGNLIYGKTYGTSANERRGDWDIEGIPTNDGGYLIAGTTDNASLVAGATDVLLIKVNGAGNVVWAKRYGGSSDDVAEGIVKTYDGGYIVVGYTYSYTNGGRDAFLLKVDSTGNMQWAKSYGDAGADRGVDVVNIGKEYVLSANRESSPGSGDYDPLFIRTDSLGNCGCNVVNAPFSVLDVTSSIIVNNIPSANYQSFTPVTNFPSPIVGSPSPLENFICIGCSATTPFISVTPTVTCEGSPITLSNLSSTTSAVCFEWMANGSPLNISPIGTSTITMSAGTYNIELRATCGNTINSVQRTIIVNPKPNANFTYTDHVCVDKQPVNYFNTGSTGGGFTYQWYLGNGAVPSTTTSQNATNVVYAFGGSKNVSLVVTNIYGCKDSINKTITIEPLPNLVFSATNPTCVGDTTYFTNYSWLGGSGTIANWYWNFGDGNNSAAFQPKHVYSSAGNYTVMLVATSDYGCDDTLYKVVNISPPTIAGNVISNATVCAVNNGGTLNVTGNNGNIVQWEYSPDGGINWYSIANTTSSQTYSNLPVTTIYRALVKSGACPAAYTSPNATITVTPPSNAGILMKDTSVCAGTNTILLSLSNYTGNINNWYSSNTVTGPYTAIGNTTSTYTVTNLNNTMYYYVVVNSGICPPDTSNIISINVSPQTVGGTVVPTTTVCAASNGGTLSLISYTGSILNWEFSTDGGINWIPLSNTSASQTYSMLTTTTLYRVKVKSGVCPEQYSYVGTIYVDPVSNAGILKKDTIVCIEGNTGTLTLNNYTGIITNWYSSVNGITWNALNNYTNTYTYNNLNDTTQFYTIVKSGVCPEDTSNIVTVYVMKFNGAYTLPTDTSISLGYTIQIFGQGGQSYLWIPSYNISDTAIANPFVWPLKDTVYKVIVTNQYGCVDTASVRIFVKKDYNLVIANTITPNGDNLNDYFWIGFIENYPNNEVIIFNRYGQEIFKGTNYDNKKVYWDGTYQGNKVPDGAYYYVIKFKDTDVVFKGSINVISSH